MLIGNGTLLLGDCLDVMRGLPSESVDLTATDPPFGMAYQSNRRVVKEQHAKIHGDDSLDWLDPFVVEAYRVAKPNTAGYFFCSHHAIDVFKQALERCFKIKNLLVWEKTNHGTGDLKGDFAPKLEFCWFVHKGRALIRGKRDPNIMRFARTQNELHPTQKPVELMEYLINKFSDEGQLVLDPFMGSGTTAIAAERSGRRWIGIERDEGYYNAALARIWTECAA